MPNYKLKTYYENNTLEEVIQSAIYTDDNMFGEERWLAQVELCRRVPTPDWAKCHNLPTDVVVALELE